MAKNNRKSKYLLILSFLIFTFSLLSFLFINNKVKRSLAVGIPLGGIIGDVTPCPPPAGCPVPTGACSPNTVKATVAPYFPPGALNPAAPWICAPAAGIGVIPKVPIPGQFLLGSFTSTYGVAVAPISLLMP